MPQFAQQVCMIGPGSGGCQAKAMLDLLTKKWIAGDEEKNQMHPFCLPSFHFTKNVQDPVIFSTETVMNYVINC